MRALTTLVSMSIAPLLCAQGWQWSKHIGGPGDDGARIGGVDAAGAVYVYGYYGIPMPQTVGSGCYFENDTLNGKGAFIVKYDAAGDMVWLKDSPDENGTVGFGDMLIDTLNGVFYAVGSLQGNVTLDTVSVFSGSAMGFVSKWTLDGACLWVRPVATGTAYTSVYTLTMAPDGELMLAGITGSVGPTIVGGIGLLPGSFLAGCDTDGEVLWAKQLMAYTSQQRRFTIFKLRNMGSDVVGYGQVVMNSPQDTIRVDDVYFTGGSGGAAGVVRLTASTGIAQWLRVVGYPGAGLGHTAPERIAVDGAGVVVCVGPWIGSAIFATDTLLAADGEVRSFFVRYDPIGNESTLVDFGTEQAGKFSLASVRSDEQGTLLLSAAFTGTVDLNGFQFSIGNGNWSSLLLQLDLQGNCLAADATGIGVHANAISTGSGVYALGNFPTSPWPTGSTSIGGAAYTTHGWWDVILARHDLLTSVPQPMAPEGDRLEIYANPNRGSFRLRLPSALANERQLQLRIYDGTGRMVIEQQLILEEQSPLMDVRGVAPGFYMVTVSNGKLTCSGNLVVE